MLLVVSIPQVQPGGFVPLASFKVERENSSHKAGSVLRERGENLSRVLSLGGKGLALAAPTTFVLGPNRKKKSR